MLFTVILYPPAEQHLAAAWMAAPDRSAVTLAAYLMEQKLSLDPLRAGESRGSSVSRVDYLQPLGFDVILDDAIVNVTAIWLVS